jgi:hypothetical protein
MPLNNPGTSIAPLSSPAQASPSTRGFTPPVTSIEVTEHGGIGDGMKSSQRRFLLVRDAAASTDSVGQLHARLLEYARGDEAERVDQGPAAFLGAQGGSVFDPDFDIDDVLRLPLSPSAPSGDVGMLVGDVVLFSGANGEIEQLRLFRQPHASSCPCRWRRSNTTVWYMSSLLTRVACPRDLSVWCRHSPKERRRLPDQPAV